MLLLGVGHDSNSSLHLAELRSDAPAQLTRREGAAVLDAGRRRWIEYQDYAYDESDFCDLGDAFIRDCVGAKQGFAGLAACQLFHQRALLSFAGNWFRARRRS